MCNRYRCIILSYKRYEFAPLAMRQGHIAYRQAKANIYVYKISLYNIISH